MSTKRKQSYLLFAIVGILGLVFDRLVLSDVDTVPAKASASQAQIPVKESGFLSMPELPFPKNLEPYSTHRAIRDIFAMPTDLQPATAIEDATAQMGADQHPGGDNEALTAAQFLLEHHLDGLLDTNGLRLAIVDGQWLRVGQLISGCTLERIIGTSAHFECVNGPAELKIGRAGLDNKQ